MLRFMDDVSSRCTHSLSSKSSTCARDRIGRGHELPSVRDDQR